MFCIYISWTFIVLVQGTKFPKMVWDSEEEVNGTQQVNPVWKNRSTNSIFTLK